MTRKVTQEDYAQGMIMMKQLEKDLCQSTIHSAGIKVMCFFIILIMKNI